jgi:hypothetical protein
MKLFRWRIRTSIILIALLAGLMGIGTSLRSAALDRKEAIATINRKHGTYAIRITGSAWSRELMKRFGADDTSFYNLTRINFGPRNAGYDSETPFRDGDLEEMAGTLSGFPDLRELDLTDSKVTDRGIANLPRLPKLKLLILEGTRITDDVIPYLQRFPSLTKISVIGTKVTRSGLREIHRRCPTCEIQSQ